jgi:acyl-CoA synthetase (AMP-forming)/AMP-acid ligase II
MQRSCGVVNLSWWLERAWWEHPEKEAVVDGDGTSATYAGLRGLSNRIGGTLRHHAGVQEDDVVVTVMADDQLHVAIFYAVMRLGGVFSGLNRRSTREKFLADVQRCEPKVLIVSPEFVEVARWLEKSSRIEQIYVTNGSHEGYDSLLEICASTSEELRIVSRSATDLAAINFTAGTSGASKGVMMTHGKLGSSALMSTALAGVTSRARNISLVSMFHSGGIIDCIRFVAVGGTILWSDGWDVERVMRILREREPNWIFHIVPTMVRDLMHHPAWDGVDLRGLRTHVAGEPVPADVLIALEAKGATVGNLYGLTEAMSIVLGVSLYYGDQAGVPELASGKPNKEFCEVKLVDAVSGERLEGGDVEGEICIRGDVVTPGYYGDPQRTTDAIDEEGFLHTRDNAYRDPDGWYYIRGRTDDIIASGGEKLSLLELDEVLLAHPDVKDAGCVAVAHERFGTVPAAFVVMHTNVDEAQARDLLDAYFQTQIERWKRPRLYALIDAIPRTAAKQTKAQAALREYLEGITVSESDGVTTLTALRATR